MADKNQLEFWLRGPIPGIVPGLQPVVHALLQARYETLNALEDFPQTMLWQKPGGVASVAFHLQHLAGVLDRLFTYAREEQLSPAQLGFLQSEGIENPRVNLAGLLSGFESQVEIAITQLKITTENDLLQTRGVGRKQIPSTVLGLMFHAAEHTQRHTGQLLVTARILKAGF